MSTKANSFSTAMIFVTIVCLALFASGCSRDEEQAGLTDTGDNSPDFDPNAGNAQFADAPPIPKPKAPTDDPGAISTVMTNISSAPLPNFSPYVTKALVDWEISTKRGVHWFGGQAEWCDWLPRVSGEHWSNWGVLDDESVWGNNPGCKIDATGSIITFGLYSIDLTPDFNPFPARHKLFVNGAPKTGTDWSFTSSVDSQYCVLSFCLNQYRLSRGYREIQARPYLRRDRFWRRKTLEGGAGKYLLLRGPVSGDIATTVSQGVKVGQTESFAQSLSVTAGADWEVVKLEVQATLTQTFGSSVEISVDTTVTFTKHVWSAEGKQVQFMVWELVDVYSFTNSKGEPLTDPNYQFDLKPLEFSGEAIVLDGTVWDL